MLQLLSSIPDVAPSSNITTKRNSRSSHNRRCRNRFSCHSCFLVALVAIIMLPCILSLHHEEDNEIFTVREDSAILKEVKKSPDFIESDVASTAATSTRDLEETIRDSVKTEIELEQNISGFLDVLKDISEPDVRQKLTEEILAIEYPHKTDKGDDEQATDPKLNRTESEDRKLVNLIADGVAGEHNQADSAPTNNTTNNLSVLSGTSNETLVMPISASSLREARNLNGELEEQPNSLKEIENILDSAEDVMQTPIVHPPKIILSTSPAPVHLEVPLLENALAEEHSKGRENSIEKDGDMPHMPANPNWSIENDRLEEEDESAKTIPVTHAYQVHLIESDNTEAITTPESQSAALSIVLEESLSATELPVVLTGNNLLDWKSPNSNIEESDEVDLTMMLETSSHSVIKKQGVELDVKLAENDDSTIAPQEYTEILTTTVSPTPADSTEHTELSINAEDARFDVHENENADSEESRTNVSVTEATTENQTPVVEVETTTTIAVDAVEDTTAATTAIPSELGASTIDSISVKGSRSVNTLLTISPNTDELSATLLQSFLPRDAGQTVNGNLADESSVGVGKALPTRSINETTVQRSTIVILLCSSIALIFIVISMAIFLISFQRQHGTLDIEMQERRCGKDNLDEEDDDGTSLKLLEIELPTPTPMETAVETDECL